MEDRFPKENDISILKTTIDVGIKTNPTNVVKMYNKFISPYYEQIENEDENYFMNEKLVHLINNSTDMGETMNKIEYVKTLLADNKIAHKDKKCIWTYLKLLNRLLEKIKDNKEIIF